MRERWNLGAPFTARDASAPSFASVMSLPNLRPPEDWPEINARPVPKMPDTLVPLDAPLGLIGKSLFLAVLSLAAGLGATVPDMKPEQEITGSQALAMTREVLGDLFPAMRAP
jgi:phospholipase C